MITDDLSYIPPQCSSQEQRTRLFCQNSCKACRSRAIVNTAMYGFPDDAGEDSNRHRKKLGDHSENVSRCCRFEAQIRGLFGIRDIRLTTNLGSYHSPTHNPHLTISTAASVRASHFFPRHLSRRSTGSIDISIHLCLSGHFAR